MDVQQSSPPWVVAEDPRKRWIVAARVSHGINIVKLYYEYQYHHGHKPMWALWLCSNDQLIAETVQGPECSLTDLLAVARKFVADFPTPTKTYEDPIG